MSAEPPLPDSPSGDAQRESSESLLQRLTSPAKPPEEKAADRPLSIKARLLRIVLVPCIALIVVYTVPAVYFLGTGFQAREIAVTVRDVSIPALQGLGSLQRERQLSISAITNPQNAPNLKDQRTKSDTGLKAMNEAIDGMLFTPPDAVLSKLKAMEKALDGLPHIRAQVDDRTATPQAVLDAYDKILDAAATLFDAQARAVPDVTTLQGALAGVDLFIAADFMSRSTSLAVSGLAANHFTQADLLEYSRLVGSARQQLNTLKPKLLPTVQQQYTKLVQSADYKRLSRAQDNLVRSGAWSGHMPAKVAADEAIWQQTSNPVSDSLANLVFQQTDEVSSAELKSGNTNLIAFGAGALLALLLVIGVIVQTVRRSAKLADGTVRAGLEAAAARSTAFANVLPGILDRIDKGEKVEADEVLAEAEKKSERVASNASSLPEFQKIDRANTDVVTRLISASTETAIARQNMQELLVTVARRQTSDLNQIRETLAGLYAMSENSHDPAFQAKVLEGQHRLDRLDVQTTNLITLGGGQRRIRRTAETIDEVLLSARARSSGGPSRVVCAAAPPWKIAARHVLDVRDLLVPLLDNAANFSPTTVHVSCEEVARGIAIEIVDRGLGMSDEQKEDARAIIQNESNTITPEGVKKQGFFVVRRHARAVGARVDFANMRDLYGGEATGTKVVVLLPRTILDTGEPEPNGAPESAAPAPAPRHLAPEDLGPAQQPSLGAVPAAAGSYRPTAFPAQPGTDRGWMTGQGRDGDRR